MFGERDNQKDTQQNFKDTSQKSQKDVFSMAVSYDNSLDTISNYPKLNKLIVALYIVTDIMDKEEPIRLKLRTLGTDILSDINPRQSDLYQKIQTVLSFLDISLSVNIISEMNFNILKKEFIELSELLPSKKPKRVDPDWLRDFLLASPEPASNRGRRSYTEPKSKEESRISAFPGNGSSFASRKQRQNDIIEIIKKNGGAATIADIKDKVTSLAPGEGVLSGLGGKTLQRELVSMVKEGLLSKTGEKRWSRYSIREGVSKAGYPSNENPI